MLCLRISEGACRCSEPTALRLVYLKYLGLEVVVYELNGFFVVQYMLL